MPQEPNRVAFVVNALTGLELRAGNVDVSRVYTLLLRSDLGRCSPHSPKPNHDCKSREEFWSLLGPVLVSWRSQDRLIFYFSGHGAFRRGLYCLKVGASNRDYLLFKSLMNDLEAAGVAFFWSAMDCSWRSVECRT